MTKAILEQALDALVGYRREMRLMLGDEESQPCDAEQAIRAHLDQSQGEPVAWINPAGTYAEASTSSTVYGSHTIPLYIHPAHTEAEPCKWTLDDEESGTYASCCGELWSFIEGGPAENRVRYCHHCGKPVFLGVPAP